MKVLVVDDDPDQLIIRCMLLTHHGFETKPAGDAASALRVGLAEQPAMAVLDLRLPTQAVGLTLIRELRELLPELSIIVFTGADPKLFRHKLEMQAVDEIVIKGSSSTALLKALTRVAAKRAPEQAKWATG